MEGRECSKRGRTGKTLHWAFWPYTRLLSCCRDNLLEFYFDGGSVIALSTKEGMNQHYVYSFTCSSC